MALIPGELSICVWSPELNKAGNSLAGTAALELLAERLGCPFFNSLHYASRRHHETNDWTVAKLPRPPCCSGVPGPRWPPSCPLPPGGCQGEGGGDPGYPPELFLPGLAHGRGEAGGHVAGAELLSAEWKYSDEEWPVALASRG